MKTTKFTRAFSIILVLGIFISSMNACKKEDDEPVNNKKQGQYDPTPYEFDIPDHFPNFVVPDFNTTTEEGIAMGKRIYYDKMLSVGGPLDGKSCASCHVHKTNFSNNNDGTSVMPHTNLHWTSYWLWNGGKAGTLEDVMLFEITEFFQADIDLFNSDTTYKRMSFEAFGSEEVTAQNMSYAVAQWVRTLISSNSKFDRFYNFEEELSPLEQRGMQLFNTEQGDCFHCHSTPLTTDQLFHNIGLDSIPTDQDMGRYLITNNESDIGKFKTPSLRNVELTAPYMHDGRFKTLEEVVEHYNSGVKHSNTLDPIMTKPGKEYGLGLSEYDKAAIVAFLKTFTDEEYINDPRFDDPFE